MGKNHNSVVVFQIQLKFWWMIPISVKLNHTKFEPKTQRHRLGMGVGSGQPRVEKLQFRAKNSFFFPQNHSNLF